MATSISGTDGVVFGDGDKLGTVVGTVSQTAGVPNGAVIQRHSGSGVETVRFADGTQICTFQASIAATALNAQAVVTHPTLPLAFVDTSYKVQITPTHTSSGNVSDIGAAIYNGIYIAAAAKTTTNPNISMYAYRLATSTTVYCDVTMIGRWF